MRQTLPISRSKIADAGFARVVADDFEDSVVVEDEVFLAQAGLRPLFLDEILARDLQLFLLGVALQAENFHAVLQRGRNGVEHVGRGDKENLREVVVDVEIVVLEGNVSARGRGP